MEPSLLGGVLFGAPNASPCREADESQGHAIPNLTGSCAACSPQLLLGLGSLTWLLANLRGRGPWEITCQRGCRRQALGLIQQLCVLHLLFSLKLHESAEGEEATSHAEISPVRNPDTGQQSHMVRKCPG